MKRFFILSVLSVVFCLTVTAAEYLQMLRPNVTWYYVGKYRDTPFIKIMYSNHYEDYSETIDAMSGKFDVRQARLISCMSGSDVGYEEGLVMETGLTMSEFYHKLALIQNGAINDASILYNFDDFTSLKTQYPGHEFLGATTTIVDGVERDCYLFDGGKLVVGIGLDGPGYFSDPFFINSSAEDQVAYPDDLCALSHVVENGKIIYRGSAFEDVTKLVREGVVWTFRVRRLGTDVASDFEGQLYQEFFHGTKEIDGKTYACLYRLKADAAPSNVSNGVEPRAYVRQEGAKVYSRLNPLYEPLSIDAQIAEYENGYYTHFAQQQSVDEGGEILIYDFDDMLAPQNISPAYGYDETTETYLGQSRRITELNMLNPSLKLPAVSIVEGLGIDSYDYGDLISPMLISPTSLVHDIVGLETVREYLDYRTGAAQTSGINELGSDKVLDDRYFDLMGRVVKEPAAGTLYIHGGKVIRF